MCPTGCLTLDTLLPRPPHLQDPTEFVSYVGDGPSGPQYCVNTVRFMDVARLKALEAAARDK